VKRNFFIKHNINLDSVIVGSGPGKAAINGIL